MVNNGAATTYSYNAANELATSNNSAGVTTYAFDGDGNVVTALAPGNQPTTSAWDGENRLTSVFMSSGVAASFTYNGDGQRVQKQVSTVSVKHVWDEQNILLETDLNNNVQVLYSMEPRFYGKLISESRSGAQSFYLFDSLGSTRQLVNSAAQ